MGLALAGLALWGGCGELRPQDPRPATYAGQVRRLLTSRCARCHSGNAPAGDYALTSYLQLLGPGSDRTTRNVIPGSARSRLLTKLDPTREPAHWGHLLPADVELTRAQSPASRREADHRLLTAWVLDNAVAHSDAAVHPPAWVYPRDRGMRTFHGGALRANGWDTETCTPCHGADLKGGEQGGGPCTACHAQGVEACTVCHGTPDPWRASLAPPPDLSWRLSPSFRGVGAHAAHLKAGAGGRPFSPVSCASCHVVPSSTRAAGHLFDDAAARTSDLRAEVTFSDLARGKPRGLDLKPAYDPAASRCDNTYCHGLPGGKVNTWSWIGEPAGGGLSCASCHAFPPAKTLSGGSHPASGACAGCHASAYDSAGQLKAAAHLNGKVDL